MAKKTGVPVDSGKKKRIAGLTSSEKKGGNDSGLQVLGEVQEIVDVDNFWKLETIIWSRMKVVKVRDNDFGTLRYFRIFYRELANSEAEKKDFISHSIYNQLLNEDDDEFKNQLDLSGDECEYILKTAQKCTPEVYNYFKTAFGGSDASEGELISGLDSFEVSSLQQRESEKILGLMQSHIVALRPVKTTITELTPEQYKEYQDLMVKNNIIQFPEGIDV